MKKYTRLKKSLPELKRQPLHKKILKGLGVTLGLMCLSVAALNLKIGLTPHTELPDIEKIEEKFDTYNVDSSYFSSKEQIFGSYSNKTIVTRRQVAKDEKINLMFSSSSPQIFQDAIKYNVDYLNDVFSHINKNYVFGVIVDPTTKDTLQKNNISIIETTKISNEYLGTASSYSFIGQNGLQLCFGEIKIKKAFIEKGSLIEISAVILHEMMHQLGFYDAYMLQDIQENMLDNGVLINSETTYNTIMSRNSRILMPNDKCLLEAMYGNMCDTKEDCLKFLEYANESIYDESLYFADIKSNVHEIINNLPKYENDYLNQINSKLKTEYTKLDLDFNLGNSIIFETPISETTQYETICKKAIVNYNGLNTINLNYVYNFEGSSSVFTNRRNKSVLNVDGILFYDDQVLAKDNNSGKLVGITNNGFLYFYNELSNENYKMKQNEYIAEKAQYINRDNQLGENSIFAEIKAKIVDKLKENATIKKLGSGNSIKHISDYKNLKLKRISQSGLESQKIAYIMGEKLYSYLNDASKAKLISMEFDNQLFYIGSNTYAEVRYTYNPITKNLEIIQINTYVPTNESVSDIQAGFELFTSKYASTK